ncbi:MAG: CDP-diacylglycerol--glycerol-3-phosphate 3-phosphatidyltransferase [Desulfovibrio sp.]|jgi:CDP-diacylglycerol--glycerol-3-phosphate 3-phosphatidyltransferase|nr:CDP-diacylglycerol--glycerol-3-phosphate 3-phosphatidyltransferase [Desulfovibrio sp.]
MFNLANKITLLRIVMTPLVVILLYFEGPVFCILATCAFIFASITDWADGYIARRENIVTSVGKFLDPLADKVLICSVLIMFVKLDWAPAWAVIIIVCRELIVTGLRAMASDAGICLAADKFGKTKTILQIIAIIPIMMHYPLWGVTLSLIGEILLYLALVMAVFSGANYCLDFYKNTYRGKQQP